MGIPHTIQSCPLALYSFYLVFGFYITYNGTTYSKGHISEQHDSVCMLFACITNFSFADVKDDDATGGPISQLHRIISDFDDTLSEPYFNCIEKIKSTGPVYMAAAGQLLLM